MRVLGIAVVPAFGVVGVVQEFEALALPLLADVNHASRNPRIGRGGEGAECQIAVNALRDAEVVQFLIHGRELALLVEGGKVVVNPADGWGVVFLVNIVFRQAGV